MNLGVSVRTHQPNAFETYQRCSFGGVFDVFLFLHVTVAIDIAVAMLLARACRPNFVRKSSTLVGRSGRVYARDKVLQAHPKKSELNVYLAQ